MYTLLLVILVALDQLTKSLAISHLKNTGMVKIVDNWLYLTYVENRGAAFGMLNDKPWFFTILASAFVIFMLYYVIKNRNSLGTFYKVSIVIIISGALGNLIDRIRLGYVVDFIFSPLGGLYDFPVFNFADVYLSVMAIILVIYMIFFEAKDSEN